jgi:seryl-tRNA synthetase
MLDLGFVRDNLELVKQKMGERGLEDSLGGFETIDRERRKFLLEAETRKARRNKVSDEIATLKNGETGRLCPDRRDEAGGRGNSGVGRAGQGIRRAIARAPAQHSQPASRERSRWP